MEAIEWQRITREKAGKKNIFEKGRVEKKRG